MSISIVINTETAFEARQHMLELLGAGLVPVRGVSEVNNDTGHDATDGAAAEAALAEFKEKGGTPMEDVKRDIAARVPGQPSPGAKRRTKAEIAEDEEAEKLAASQRVAAVKADVLADAAAATTETVAEDDAATVEQDEADEAAETAAAVDERPADKKLTHDDVRQALGAYVKLYGMAAAQADGPKVIALALKNDKAAKISDIPDTQEALAAVVAGVAEMTAKNPFKHPKVA